MGRAERGEGAGVGISAQGPSESGRYVVEAGSYDAHGEASAHGRHHSDCSGCAAGLNPK